MEETPEQRKERLKKEANQRYYQKHKETIRQKIKAYQQKWPQTQVMYQHLYYLKNRERIAANYRARMLNQPKPPKPPKEPKSTKEPKPPKEPKKPKETKKRVRKNHYLQKKIEANCSQGVFERPQDEDPFLVSFS